MKLDEWLGTLLSIFIGAFGIIYCVSTISTCGLPNPSTLCFTTVIWIGICLGLVRVTWDYIQYRRTAVFCCTCIAFVLACISTYVLEVLYLDALWFVAPLMIAVPGIWHCWRREQATCREQKDFHVDATAFLLMGFLALSGTTDVEILPDVAAACAVVCLVVFSSFQPYIRQEKIYTLLSICLFGGIMVAATFVMSCWYSGNHASAWQFIPSIIIMLVCFSVAK